MIMRQNEEMIGDQELNIHPWVCMGSFLLAPIIPQRRNIPEPQIDVGALGHMSESLSTLGIPLLY